MASFAGATGTLVGPHPTENAMCFDFIFHPPTEQKKKQLTSPEN